MPDQGTQDRSFEPAGTGRSDPEWIVSREVWGLFQEYRARPFVFIEPGGNYGDFLIYKGAEKLARQAGIQFTSMQHDRFMQWEPDPQAVLYIHGSGGYVPWWTDTPILELRRAVGMHPGPVILGPTTFHVDPEFLERTLVKDLRDAANREVTVLTRERVSYKALRDCIPGGVRLLLDHDTALNCRPEDLFRGKARRRLAPYALARYPLYAIRQDKEAFGKVERDPLGVWEDAGEGCYDFNHWVGIHFWAGKIIANRLHSAVIGSIFGIPTLLLPNVYHKNRSVWEHSLRQRGVQWAEHVDLTGWSRMMNAIGPLDWLLKRPFVHRVLRGVVYGARHRNLIR